MTQKSDSNYKKGLISVIIPIYGKFDINRAILSIESIRAQKGVKLEIVVSEQGISPKLQSIIPKDIKYIFTKFIPSKDISNFNPGRVRNIGFGESIGEFIYTNDADILFFDEYFLQKGISLLEQDQKLALHRPPMRRIPLENFNIFNNHCKKYKIRKTINSLDFSQEFLATMDGLKRKLKVVKKDGGYYEKTFTTSYSEFERYINNKSLLGEEPTIWTENLHCGGNLLRRIHFEEVGGYCEEFINWGGEDSDLQWKLMEMYNLKFFPDTIDFNVLHLDHERGYFSSKMWKRNEAIELERKINGISNAIKNDKRNVSRYVN